MNLTTSLEREYADLWKSCAIRPADLAEVDALVDRIAAHKARYSAVGKPLGVPWHVVGIIHMLEASGNFATQLHNGDPLTARTTHVPKGRPVHGSPPFTWEESATDALTFDGVAEWKDWSVPGTLFVFERFNGFGYRPHGIHSPYLWSFSNEYTKGKFTGDGVFSPTAVSAQCGAAVLLSRMVKRGIAMVKTVTPTPVPIDDGILRKGSKGPEVTKLKTLLKRWFDATSPGEYEALHIAPNDVFGDSLRKAVRIFQTRVGIEIDGEAGTDTLGALQGNPGPTPVPALSVAELAFPPGLKKGVVGDPVHLVQGWLTLHGFAVVVDNRFLDATVKALKRFQVSRGLPATGAVDRATWTQLVQPMTAALAPIHGVKPLGALFVAYAHQHARQKPREAGGENRGPWVRLYTGNEGPNFRGARASRRSCSSRRARRSASRCRSRRRCSATRWRPRRARAS